MRSAQGAILVLISSVIVDMVRWISLERADSSSSIFLVLEEDVVEDCLSL